LSSRIKELSEKYLLCVEKISSLRTITGRVLTLLLSLTPPSPPSSFSSRIVHLQSSSDTQSQSVFGSSQKSQSIVTSSSHGQVIRDLLLVFQGIDTTTSVRYDAATERYVLTPSVRLSRSVTLLVLRLCEVGWLVRRIRAWLEPSVDDKISSASASSITSSSSLHSRSLIEQSFRAAVTHELQEYDKLIALLSERTGITSSPQKGRDSTTLTLRRLAVWIHEPLRRLKWLTLMCEWLSTTHSSSTESTSSQRVLHVLRWCLQHGSNTSPLSRLTRTLQLRTLTPLIHMLRSWLCEGTLDDPFHEFFITTTEAQRTWQKHRQRHQTDEVTSTVTSLPPLSWSDYFTLVPPLIPPDISLDLAQNVLASLHTLSHTIIHYHTHTHSSQQISYTHPHTLSFQLFSLHSSLIISVMYQSPLHD
jgi:hypothetical protein